MSATIVVLVVTGPQGLHWQCALSSSSGAFLSCLLFLFGGGSIAKRCWEPNNAIFLWPLGKSRGGRGRVNHTWSLHSRPTHQAKLGLNWGVEESNPCPWFLATPLPLFRFDSLRPQNSRCPFGFPLKQTQKGFAKELSFSKRIDLSSF